MAQGFSFGFDDSDVEEDVSGEQSVGADSDAAVAAGGSQPGQIRPKLHSLDDLVCHQVSILQQNQPIPIFACHSSNAVIAVSRMTSQIAGLRLGLIRHFFLVSVLPIFVARSKHSISQSWLYLPRDFHISGCLYSLDLVALCFSLKYFIQFCFCRGSRWQHNQVATPRVV